MTGLEAIHLALPEIILLITACLTLLADLFIKNDKITFTTAITGLVIAAIFNFLNLGLEPVTILNGLFINDDFANLSKIFIAIVVILSFIYSYGYLTMSEIPKGDYLVLGLFSTLGMMTLVSAHSLITIYLGLELLSLPLYAMVAIRSSKTNGSEAAMKYFVMGSLASAMLLYGISMIYGASGHLELIKVAESLTDKHTEGLVIFGLVFITAGIGFKLTAVPFHMWTPDVYQGAPTTVTLFISSAPKIAALGMTVRLLIFALPELTIQWQQILLVMVLLSTFIGNLLAIAQSNLKRLFAYSTISHMGYALFGVLAATTQGYAAALYYTLIYALMSAAIFGMMALISRKHSEIEQVSDLRGLNKRSPWLAFLTMIILFSMAGVPPTVGFFIKFFVLKALVDANMLWVAVLGLVFAVIGAFYYIRIVKVMYFDKSDSSDPVKIPLVANIFLSGNCLALLYFGIFPSGLINACIAAF